VNVHGASQQQTDLFIESFRLTLTGLANLLIDYPPQPYISKQDYYTVLHRYAASQYKNGVPYVAEAHDPDNPVWIYDSFNHSEDYNHSTFNDLVISGLLGIRPQLDNSVVIHPLVPDSWDYFAQENLPYHGHSLSVLWDRSGAKYRQGSGLHVYLDGGARTIVKFVTAGSSLRPQNLFAHGIAASSE
jgi:hypothetical protein